MAAWKRSTEGVPGEGVGSTSQILLKDKIRCGLGMTIEFCNLAALVDSDGKSLME